MIKNAVFTPARLTFLLSAALLAGATAAHADDQSRMLSNQPQPPDVRLGPLFNAVQQAKFYPDQKTFADAVPKSNPSSILADWQMQKKPAQLRSQTLCRQQLYAAERGRQICAARRAKPA